MAKFDDVIEEVGVFGRYQFFIVLAFMGAAIPTSYNTFLPLFVLTSPKHRCHLDNYPNDTYAVQNDHHRQLINESIPLEEHHGVMVISSCHILRENLTITPEDVPREKLSVRCHRWVYDKTFFDESYVEKLNLVCSQKEYRTHSNVAMMVGKLVSALVQGMLSDRFGRRFTLLVFLTIVVASTFANAFIVNVATLITFRFIAGLSTTSFYMNAYVICLEFLSPRHRQRFNITAATTWLAGGFLVTGIAFGIKDSQRLILVLAAPTILLLVYFFVVPESPRWLLSRGRYAEAKVILEKVAKVNKRQFPHELFQKLVLEEQGGTNGADDWKETGDEKTETLKNEKKSTVDDLSAKTVSCTVKASSPQQLRDRAGMTTREQFFWLFKYKRMYIRLSIVLFNWCANSMTYYGIIFNTQNLSGSIYLNFTLTNAVDLAGNLASYYFVDKFGRKRSYVVCYLITSIALLAAIFPSLFADKQEADLSILLLVMVGRAGVSTTFNIMYLYVSELFPTTMRNSVLGACSLASRVGSTCAPYIADLGFLLNEDLAATLPMAVFGGAGLLATVSAAFLPETVGRKLPNNLQEALDIGRPDEVTSAPRKVECDTKTC